MPGPHVVKITYGGSYAFLNVRDGDWGKRNFGVVMAPHKGTMQKIDDGKAPNQDYVEKLSFERDKRKQMMKVSRDFPSMHWDVEAMFNFYDACRRGLLPQELMYKGTIGGNHDENTCAFQARILKEGFKWKGIKVHAHGVAKWNPIALVDYARRIQIALDQHFGKG